MIDFFKDFNNILDFFAGFFGFLSAWFARNNSVKAYPIGLISIAIYFYLLFIFGIYGDIWINLYYAVMSCYGWYQWSKKATDHQTDQLKISRLNLKNWKKTLFVFVLLILLFYLWLTFQTDSSFPFWDALTTSLGILGMYWMTKRKLEYWIFFILMDFISIFLYAQKGLWFSAVQFFALMLLASNGYFYWKKKLNQVTLN